MNQEWELILQLQTAIQQSKDKISCVFLQVVLSEIDETIISINVPLQATEDTTLVYLELGDELVEKPMSTKEKQVADIGFRINNLLDIQLLYSQTTTLDTNFLIAYLPYCFMGIVAQQNQKAISVAHFAQTLDGKIATTSGSSKWIGNDDNLKHAHRMRALCDGILIGTNTLAYDKPSLTVRHVSGKHPIRIVLGNSCQDYASLFKANAAPIITISDADRAGSETIEHLRLTNINCEKVLQLLFQKGIHSVYVEGGATTTSNFLKEGMIDILQLHLSPLIFGSGISAISLPEIQEVKEAIQFRFFKFLPVGDTAMFVGLL